MNLDRLLVLLIPYICHRELDSYIILCSKLFLFSDSYSYTLNSKIRSESDSSIPLLSKELVLNLCINNFY